MADLVPTDRVASAGWRAERVATREAPSTPVNDDDDDDEGVQQWEQRHQSDQDDDNVNLDGGYGYMPTPGGRGGGGDDEEEEEEEDDDATPPTTPARATPTSAKQRSQSTPLRLRTASPGVQRRGGGGGGGGDTVTCSVEQQPSPKPARSLLSLKKALGSTPTKATAGEEDPRPTTHPSPQPPQRRSSGPTVHSAPEGADSTPKRPVLRFPVRKVLMGEQRDGGAASAASTQAPGAQAHYTRDDYGRRIPAQALGEVRTPAMRRKVDQPAAGGGPNRQSEREQQQQYLRDREQQAPHAGQSLQQQLQQGGRGGSDAAATAAAAATATAAAAPAGGGGGGGGGPGSAGHATSAAPVSPARSYSASAAVLRETGPRDLAADRSQDHVFYSSQHHFSYKPLNKKGNTGVDVEELLRTNIVTPASNGQAQCGAPGSVRALRLAEREAREAEEKERQLQELKEKQDQEMRRRRTEQAQHAHAGGGAGGGKDGDVAFPFGKKKRRDPRKEEERRAAREQQERERREAEEKEADEAAAAAAADGASPGSPGGKVPPRHRDISFLGLARKNARQSRKSKDRVKVYVNAAGAKQVVLNAVNTCRFEFAPLRDTANLLWLDRGISVDAAKALVDEKQRMNRYPGMREICNKALFTRHLNRISALFPEDFEFYPQTFCLPGDEEDLQNMMARNALLKKKNKKKIDDKRPIWICKPSKGRQGTGIFLTQDLSDVVPEKGAAPESNVEYVVQRYLNDPLLIDGLKFDLRLYVVVLGVDPLRIYLYEEGLARFATNQYKPLEGGAMHDAYMHLTNYSLNKDSENFVTNTEGLEQEGGSKRSLASVRKWMGENGYDPKKAWDDINSLIINTMLALQPSLQLNVESITKPGDDNFKCFQILGFDVMFDADQKPWLLEINAGPSLDASSPLDQSIKEPLVVSSMRLGTFGLMPRMKPSLKKAFEAGHFGALTQIFPSPSSHESQHLVLFNKELRAAFEAACGLKGEMTASRFCRFFREAGVIRSFKQIGSQKKEAILKVEDAPTAMEKVAPIYSTNKAFELRKRMLDGKGKGDDLLYDDNDFSPPDGYEPRYGMAQNFNIDIPANLIDKVRTLTQPELELLFLRKLKTKDKDTTRMSFFEFINIVVEMAIHSYKAKEFDDYTLLQKLRLFIPQKKAAEAPPAGVFKTPKKGGDSDPPKSVKDLVSPKADRSARKRSDASADPPSTPSKDD